MSLAPDILLLVTALLTLVADAAMGAKKPALPRMLAMAGTVVVLLLLLFGGSGAGGSGNSLPTYDLSGFGKVWRLAFTGMLLAVQILSSGKQSPAAHDETPFVRDGALHVLLLFSALGMFVLISAREWLTFFLGLELATLPLIALVAFRARHMRGVEAGMKLVIMSALAMALNVFGLSLIYGAVGSLTFAATQTAASAAVASGAITDPLLLLGAFLVLASLLFKVAAFPFHMWAPDVYEGSPFSVTAFLAVASKAAGFAAIAKVFFGPLAAIRPTFAGFFVLAALATQVIGNLGAMRQTHFFRFIAYSSIAQSGFILLAFVGDGQLAEEAIVFNVFSYGLASLVLFCLWRGTMTHAEHELSALAGLSRRSPAAAFGISLALISLAGVPPLAGFMGKFLVFQSVAMSGHYTVLAFALANAVVSLYYYARWVHVTYTLPSSDAQSESSSHGGATDPASSHSENQTQVPANAPGYIAWGGWIAATGLVLLGITPFLLNALHAVKR